MYSRELLRGQVVLAAVVVAQAVVIEHVRRRSRCQRLLLRLLLACCAAQTLLRRLHVFQLLADLGQARLEFIHGVVQRLNLPRKLVDLRPESPCCLASVGLKPIERGRTC